MRRGAVWGILLSLACVGILTAGASVACAATATPASPALGLDPLSQAFAQKYGIRLLLDARAIPAVPKGWTFEQLGAADEAQTRIFLRYLREEMGRYPVPFVKATGLKTIVLAKNMKIGAAERGAIPDFANDAVWYDPFMGTSDEMYNRHCIHHEFFHFADEALQGPAYLTDPYWASLNRPDFHYGNGGAHARGGDQWGVTNREAGFVNRYSTSGLEEDRAEIFASMWIPMEANILEQRSRSDAILRGKIHRMRGMMNYYGKGPRDAKDVAARELFVAVRSRDSRAMEKLLGADATAPATARDWLGRSALHWAAMVGDANAARKLLAAAPALANADDDDGWTPLHVGAFLGNTELVRALLDGSADVGRKDKRGGTAAKWARVRGNAEVIQLFQAASTTRAARD